MYSFIDYILSCKENNKWEHTLGLLNYGVTEQVGLHSQELLMLHPGQVLVMVPVVQLLNVFVILPAVAVLVAVHVVLP
jgi:hypothetical protein